MNWFIEVDVIVTRTYVVEANSPEEALALYRAGDAEIDLNVSELFEGNWNEQEGTARVISQYRGEIDGS